jgi:hypothetical protein
VAEGQQGRAAAPVGSVAEEAARLLDALGGWAERSGYAGASGASAASAESAAPGASRDDDAAPSRDEAHAGHHCPECGSQTGVGRAVTCRVCPLCQGIAVLRSVRPETVDRLADLASAVAATLRDVAGQRWHEDRRQEDRRQEDRRQEDRRHEDRTPPPDRPGTGRVQDIRIDDEDAEGGQA